MKRLLDIVLILASLPVVLPVALIVAIAIKVDSPGPVLYWSPRIGKNSKPFPMPKFRSMCIGAPVVSAEEFKTADHYITRVGAFIRKTSLDEIPQFWSVLIGDMSLIVRVPFYPLSAMYSDSEESPESISSCPVFQAGLRSTAAPASAVMIKRRLMKSTSENNLFYSI